MSRNAWIQHVAVWSLLLIGVAMAATTVSPLPGDPDRLKAPATTPGKVFTWGLSKELNDAGAFPTVLYHLDRTKPVEQVIDELRALDVGGKALFVQNPLELGDDRDGPTDIYFGTAANDWDSLDDIRRTPIERGLATGDAWTRVFLSIDEPAYLLHDIHGVPRRLNEMQSAHALIPEVFDKPVNDRWDSGARWPAGSDFLAEWKKWRSWTFDDWYDIREHWEYAAFTGPFRRVFGPAKVVLGYVEEPIIDGELSYSPEAYGQRKPEGMGWQEFSRLKLSEIRGLWRLGKPMMVWLEPAQSEGHAKHNRYILRWCVRNGVHVMYWTGDAPVDRWFVDDLRAVTGAA